ncbi:MAG: DUF547 domain-containing protein [Proteobacteria bacterium]|nr:DUF547 domain-containing protein [Pseudomonadota bacterium]
MRFYFKTVLISVWIFITLGTTAVSAEPVEHRLWDRVLKEYVDDQGFVDYLGLAESPEDLEAYLEIIQTQGPRSTPGKFPSDDDELAYYLNAYNALVFKGVLDWGPNTTSVWKGLISGLKFFSLMDVHLDGQTISLQKLENNIIRARYQDPRIHAAINCASVSCPRLRRTAFTGELLQDQLNEAMAEFVQDDRHVRILKTSAQVSAIFDWFSEDFVGDREDNDRAIIDYINRYRGTMQRLPADAQLTFLKYDKSINRQKK